MVSGCSGTGGSPAKLNRDKQKAQRSKNNLQSIPQEREKRALNQ
jgi:hypothetical protein